MMKIKSMIFIYMICVQFVFFRRTRSTLCLTGSTLIFISVWPISCWFYSTFLIFQKNMEENIDILDLCSRPMWASFGWIIGLEQLKNAWVGKDLSQIVICINLAQNVANVAHLPFRKVFWWKYIESVSNCISRSDWTYIHWRSVQWVYPEHALSFIEWL